MWKGRRDEEARGRRRERREKKREGQIQSICPNIKARFWASHLQTWMSICSRLEIISSDTDKTPEWSLDSTAPGAEESQALSYGRPRLSVCLTVALCEKKNTFSLHFMCWNGWLKRVDSPLILSPAKRPSWLCWLNFRSSCTFNHCLKKNLSLQSRHSDPHQGNSVNYVSSGCGASAV